MAISLLVVVAPSAVFAAPPITAVAFAPGGRQVVFGSQSGIEIRAWPELKTAGQIPTELGHVHDLAFSPDGKTLLAAGGSPAEVGAVEVLGWPGGKRLRRVAGPRDVIYRVAWSPDGRSWASAGADGICRVHATDSGTELARFTGHSRAVLAIAFLPDGKTIASAGVDQTIQIWDAASAKPIRTLDNHVKTVNDLAVRPKSAAGAPPVLASISEDRTLRVWQPTIGRLMRFARLESIPRALAWSPDGARLLVGCDDGKLRVIDPDTLEVVGAKQILQGRIYSLAVLAGERIAVVGGVVGAVKADW